MQKDNALSSNFVYATFTILFILIGLITLASSMNLLVLRLATIDAEEKVQEKLEAAEAARQLVTVEGDVITHNKLLFEKSFAALASTNDRVAVPVVEPDQLSVCSCNCAETKLFYEVRNRLYCFNIRKRAQTNNQESQSQVNNESNNGHKKRLCFKSLFKIKRKNNNATSQPDDVVMEHLPSTSAHLS